MIGTVFDLLKGLPHEADQVSMENVRYMTILNCFLCLEQFWLAGMEKRHFRLRNVR